MKRWCAKPVKKGSLTEISSTSLLKICQMSSTNNSTETKSFFKKQDIECVLAAAECVLVLPRFN